MTVKRGDIYYADLSPVIGSEQGGVRPVLIVQNDVGNKFSPTVIAAAITSRRFKTELPTHIQVNAHGCGLAKDSIVLLEQVRTLEKCLIQLRPLLRPRLCYAAFPGEEIVLSPSPAAPRFRCLHALQNNQSLCA